MRSFKENKKDINRFILQQKEGNQSIETKNSKKRISRCDGIISPVCTDSGADSVCR